MEEANKRATKGTEHSLETNKKIGGEFKKEENASFIKERAEIWDKLYSAQEEKHKSLPQEKIKITLQDGKEVEGISNVTTPYQVAEKHTKKSELKEFLVAKVTYSKKISETQIVNVEDEQQEEKCSEKPKENFELWDLHRPLVGDCKIEFCNFETKEGKSTFWHSSAHLLGSAIETLLGAKLCIGPALEEGFYYDSFMGNYVIDPLNDYKKLEEQVKKNGQGNHPFTRLVMTKTEALELFKANPFKVQLITNKVKENDLTTAYRCGDFIDLCLGPHIPNLNMIKSLSITKNSATNWLGKVTNDSLQRVYGISFPNDKLMKEYIKRKEEEEKRDHRNIGKQLGLFMFHNLSPGSCFWYQPGAHIYNKLVEFIRNQYKVRGYQEVISPNIYNLKLWKTSGHYKNYKENLFLMKVENQGFGLKPMNCPGHCLMFDSVARSYKELPIRMADFGVLHRNEISGALSGLTRVRRFQQDDAHIFCRFDQIMDEVLGYLDFMSYVYDIFGFKYELYLSTRPEKMLGSAKLWDMAEQSLTDALNKFGKPWKINPGDGAFYGPKIDIKLFDALGRTHQCGTVQLDFQLPIRFNLMYKTEETVTKDENEEKGKKVKKEKKEKKKKGKKEDNKEEQDKEEDKKDEEKKEEEKKDEDKKEEEKKEPALNEYGEPFGKEVYKADEWDDEEFNWEEKGLKPGYARPCIVHRAILGSVERCSAILIEHYAGKFPFWLSPRQICICTINNKVEEYAEKWYLMLKYKGYQVFFDKSAATLQKKIRNAQISQFNYIGVIGAEEMKNNTIKIRSREGEIIGDYTMNKLIEFFISLEPKQSKVELDLMQKVLKDVKMEDLDSNEQKLKFNLYLNGDECSEDDKKLYQLLENENFEKEKFPNLFKWKKLMALQK